MQSIEFVVALAAVLASVALLTAGAAHTSAVSSVALNDSLASVGQANACFALTFLSSSGDFSAASLQPMNTSSCAKTFTSIGEIS